MGDILDHLHKYNSLIHLLYDRMKIDKEDLSDRTKRNIHRFIDFSLPLVSFAASDFLIEKRTLKQGTFGVSINYYPSGLDRRFLFIRGNEVLRCFINNNNIGYNEISAFFHNNSIGIDYEEIVNFIEQLFVLNTDLNKELNRYFTDIDNLNSANNEAKTYFSLMSYFNDSIYNHNKNVSFECDKPLTYENFRETYKYAYNQKVDYTQYHKLLQTISWGNQNNDSAINDNNNETRYNIYSFAVGDYYDNRKYANILLFSVEKIDIDSIVIEQLKLIFTVFMSQITNLESTYRSCRQVYTYRNKSAITSILVDSFAHNISAHSLASLKWWFELRHRMMDRRFQIGDNGTELKCINPCQLHITKDRLGKTIEEYYCALGLQDSTYNKEHASLLDIIHFYSQCKNGLDKEETGKKELELMQWESSVIIKEDSHFHPRFPVSLDYALFPYFRFLRDKGAFWSGVTRDMTFGGESKTWYKILWEDFANNPLYLGTIAKSEEIAKINIHLSVQDMREKSQDNGSRVKGNFVTIDLSIMDDEEDWVNSKKRVQAIDQDEGKYINAGKYSKYAFVKLGRCFPVFREILNDEDNYRVFLPGGIVGEHALFTIIENTLRNIKHYTDDSDAIKSIRKNGIDLWISIDKESIRIGNESKEAIICDKKSQLFKVGVWLEHLTDIYEKDEVTDEEKKEVKTDKPTDEANKTDDQFIENYLLINIAEMTCEQIIDESTGSPRMGGNSQDKICAAMLFNNTFSSTETRKDTKRDSKYYPWIDFAIKPECFELEDKLDIRPDTPIEEKEKQIEDYKKLVDGRESKRGYLKRYFHLWRGEDYIVVRNESDFEAENLSRFKIVVIPQKDKTGKVLDCYHRNNLIKKAKNAGVVRIIYDIDVPDDDKLDVKELYAKWIRNLLGLKDGTAHKMNLKLGSEGGNESTLGSFIIASDRFIYCGNHKSAYKKYLGDQYPNCPRKQLTKEQREIQQC